MELNYKSLQSRINEIKKEKALLVSSIFDIEDKNPQLNIDNIIKIAQEIATDSGSLLENAFYFYNDESSIEIFFDPDPVDNLDPDSKLLEIYWQNQLVVSNNKITNTKIKNNLPWIQQLIKKFYNNNILFLNQ